jgi:hypothetical protein
MRTSRIAAIGVVAVVGVVALAGNAFNMPMFARKTEMSCQSCHTVIPKLNETGMMFRATGWRPQADLGTEDKDVNNISTQNSTRLQTRYDGTQTTDKHGVKTKSSQLTFHEITLYPLTGAFNKNYASLFEISLAPEDFAEIENAYVRGVWKAGAGFVSARAGIFHPFEGFGASDRPLSLSRPLFQTSGAADSVQKFPFTPWNFDQAGLELGCTINRTLISATLFNGLTYDVGEEKAFPAQGGGLTKDPKRPSYANKDFQIFLTQILNANGGGVSLYYYNGAIDLPGAGGTFFKDKFFRGAAYGSYPVLSRLNLLGGYQQGDDKYKIGSIEKTSTSKGFFGEADVDLTHGYFLGGRYDLFDPSDKAERDNVRAVTVAINKPLNNGLQVIAEFQHMLTEQQGTNPSGGAYPDKKNEKFQIRGIWIW